MDWESADLGFKGQPVSKQQAVLGLNLDLKRVSESCATTTSTTSTTNTTTSTVLPYGRRRRSAHCPADARR